MNGQGNKKTQHKNGKQVHSNRWLDARYQWSYATLCTLGGYMTETTDPVTCKTCLKIMEREKATR